MSNCPVAITRPMVTLLALALVLCAAETQAAHHGKSKKPNVVIVYGDDVGYGDVGVYGSKMIPTPRIDELAKGGIRFTDGHCSAATCSPSRYSMLTGRFGFREGVRILPPTASLSIDPERFTLADMFKTAGYRTAVIGKWHLGLGDKNKKPGYWNGDVKPGPLEIGFDYSFLLPNTNDRVPCVYLENYRVVNLDPKDPISIGKQIDPRSTVYPDGRKTPEAMTYYKNSHGHNHSVINGIGRIGTQFGGKSALWNDETMTDVFVEKTARFIGDHVKQHKDKPFFLYFSSQDVHVPRTPHPRFKGKSQLGYRGDAMVAFDYACGAVMDILEKHGLAKDTIFILSSDNGPVYDDGYQDGTTVKTSTKEADRGHDGSGPWRGGKYQIYEGGTRVPFIVRWPARIKPGVSDAMVTQTDLLASFAKLLDVKVPKGQAIDSQENLAALLGEDKKGLTYMLEEAGGVALRHGNWKLIVDRGGKKRWQKKSNTKSGKNANQPAKPAGPTGKLFDLSTDQMEQTNVAAKHPERVRKMLAIVQQLKQGKGMNEVLESQSE